MSIDIGKATERSVDSIARIYAVVIGLAMTEAVRTLLAKDPGAATGLNLTQLASGFPAFVAFLVTLVPFWHGMNRHLDRCYLQKTGDIAQGALLFDFGVFFVEATLLFAAGGSLRAGVETFLYLGLLLCVDMVWGFISHQIHFPRQKSHVGRWAAINVVAVVIAILIVAFPFEQKVWVLMVVAMFRSIVDYWRCWDFYFPAPEAVA